MRPCGWSYQCVLNWALTVQRLRNVFLFSVALVQMRNQLSDDVVYLVARYLVDLV